MVPYGHICARIVNSKHRKTLVVTINVNTQIFKKDEILDVFCEVFIAVTKSFWDINL